MNALSVQRPEPTRFLTLPNFLSIIRACLAIPFSVVMLSSLPSARTWGAILIAVAALTDKLDGDLARKFGTVTEWGRILDPLADKLGAAVVVVVLLLRGEIPLWYAGVVIGRDCVILAGGIFLRIKSGVVLPSNLSGKWAFAITGFTLFLIVLGLDQEIIRWLLWLTVVLMALSLFLYFRRFAEVVRTEGAA